MKKIVIPFIISFIVVVVIFLVFEDAELFFDRLLNDLQERPLAFTFYSFLILSSDCLLPVPSSIIMYLNGSVLGLFAGFLNSYAAVIFSAIIAYFLGKLAGRRFVGRADEDAAMFLKKYGPYAIILSRGLPVLSESICFVCGYHAYNFKRYVLLNLLAYIPICLIYALLGDMGKNENVIVISLGSAVVISVLFGLLGKRLTYRHSSKRTLPD